MGSAPHMHAYTHTRLARHGVLERHHEEQRRDAGGRTLREDGDGTLSARMRGPARHERT